MQACTADSREVFVARRLPPCPQKIDKDFIVEGGQGRSGCQSQVEEIGEKDLGGGTKEGVQLL